MRSDVARSIALVMLMIVSVQMPMFDNAEEPVELKEEPLIEMVAQNPCQGYDACLGYDAGGYNARNEVCPGGTGTCAVANLTSGLEEESENERNYAKSWEDLPPGGQYTETVPMRYEGEDCGIWEQREDESWVKK